MHRLCPSNIGPLRTELAALLPRSVDLRYSHRLHAVLLVGTGHSCYRVADWFGDNARSIERWVHAYQLLGVDGLKAHPGSGRPGRLTAAQSTQLALDLASEPGVFGFQPPRWSGKLLALHLKRQFGVTLSPRRCQRLLQLHRH